MEPTRDLTALQHAADWDVVRKDLRVVGVGSTLLGALALLVAIAPPPDPALLVLGAALSATGLWNLTRPHPRAILSDGAALALVGLYDVGMTLIAGPDGSKASPLWGLLGAFQVAWGAQAIVHRRRVADAFRSRPSDEELRCAAALLDELRRARVREEPDVIEFAADSGQPLLVRARLLGDHAIVLFNRGEDVRVVGRDEFQVRVVGPSRFARTGRTHVLIGSRDLKASLSPEMLERFQRWKTGAEVSRPSAA